MTNSSKIETIVDDIYDLINRSSEVSDEEIEELAKDIAQTIRDRLSQTDTKRKTLTLSSVGKPIRKLWYDIKVDDSFRETPPPYMKLKFLYGDIIECILLWLAKVCGHDVKDRQREVKFHGITGHIDSIIDGHVVDIKSASSRSFKKFSQGTLNVDDPFGYLAQIESYDQVVGNGEPAFLAMDKVTGELALYKPDKLFDLPDAGAIIDRDIEALKKDTPPEELCYEPVPDGKSGNMKLDKGCEWCPYKKLCYPGLRAFKYSDGVRYLTSVVKEPRVEEIINGEENDTDC